VPAPRLGAKQEVLLALLRRPQGATVADLQTATGRQPHSVRGALSGLVRKKLGLAVTSSKDDNRGRVYRID
jgi:DNA-binding IclR family transcriptional regulator